MHRDTHDAGREERRAQLERRRAAVAHELRPVVIELANLDRKLTEIEQSARWPNANTRCAHAESGHRLGPLDICTYAPRNRAMSPAPELGPLQGAGIGSGQKEATRHSQGLPYPFLRRRSLKSGAAGS